MKQKSRTLTLQTLIEKEACAEQLALFQTTFGAQVKITVALCVSVSEDFNFEWAADQLLSRGALGKCGEMCRAAEVTATKCYGAAKEAKMKSSEAAWTKYNETGQIAWEEYREASKRAYLKNEKALNAIWVKCRKSAAAAFAECYIDDRA